MLAVDEAVTLAQGVESGNENTLSFWLLPQWHSTLAKGATVKNRGLLEDKVLGYLVIWIHQLVNVCQWNLLGTFGYFPKPPISCAKGYGHVRSGPEFPRFWAPGRPQEEVSAMFLGDCYPRSDS